MRQTVPLWSIRLKLDGKPAEDARLALETALEPFGEAISSFETDNGKGWLIEVFSQAKPAARDVAAALKPLGSVMGLRFGPSKPAYTAFTLGPATPGR